MSPLHYNLQPEPAAAMCKSALCLQCGALSLTMLSRMCSSTEYISRQERDSRRLKQMSTTAFRLPPQMLYLKYAHIPEPMFPPPATTDSSPPDAPLYPPPRCSVHLPYNSPPNNISLLLHRSIELLHSRHQHEF